jgi:hypothetical protein
LPSLAQLREFKTSFQSLAHEMETRTEENLPEDDLELPTSEPEPENQQEPESEGTGLEGIPGLDDGDLDFSDFLSTTPDQVSPPPPPPEAEPQAEPAP